MTTPHEHPLVPPDEATAAPRKPYQPPRVVLLASSDTESGVVNIPEVSAGILAS